MTDGQHIFINYRRSDTAFAATFLYSKLAAAFGTDAVFKDIDSFQPGDDFPAKLAQCVENSQIFLALVGSKWLSVADAKGPRINNPRDWVRIEIASALRFNKLVIPVLIDNAEMPAARDLPDVLRPLADKHAFRVSADRADQELDHLVTKLKSIAKRLEHERADSERLAKEEAAEKAQAELARAELEKARLAEKTKAAASVKAQTAKASEKPRKPKVVPVAPAQTPRHAPQNHGFVPKTSWSLSGRAQHDNSTFLGLLLATIIFAAFIYAISLPFTGANDVPVQEGQADPPMTE